MEQKQDSKYEYRHYDLGYSLHYGIHSIFGEHLALGRGPNMVHLYNNRIYIGDRKENSVALTPEQQQVMRNVFSLMRRKIEMEAPRTDKAPELNQGTGEVK